MFTKEAKLFYANTKVFHEIEIFSISLAYFYIGIWITKSIQFEFFYSEKKKIIQESEIKGLL